MRGKEIDSIIISHAHIDHSGGAPKAHAMWPEANIIATAPTKVFLKYLYSDMARVKNDIVDVASQKEETARTDLMRELVSEINEQFFYLTMFYLEIKDTGKLEPESIELYADTISE